MCIAVAPISDECAQKKKKIIGAIGYNFRGDFFSLSFFSLYHLQRHRGRTNDQKNANDNNFFYFILSKIFSSFATIFFFLKFAQHMENRLFKNSRDCAVTKKERTFLGEKKIYNNNGGEHSRIILMRNSFLPFRRRRPMMTTAATD